MRKYQVLVRDFSNTETGLENSASVRVVEASRFGVEDDGTLLFVSYGSSPAGDRTVAAFRGWLSVTEITDAEG